MKNEKIKDEAEIAEVAKVFLEMNSWILYPEVVIDLFNGRPDYICVKNSLCQVVECKKTLSYPVVEQLTRWKFDAEKRKEWRRYGSYEIAIPHLLVAFVGHTSGGIADLKRHILNEHRIGVFTVEKRWNRHHTSRRTDEPYFSTRGEESWTLVWGDFEYDIRQRIEPKIQHGSRKTAYKIIDSLDDDMKCAQAGVKGGETEYMTPFKRTMNRVKTVLSDGKERHINHIIEEIQPLGGHHYCSDKVAMSSITKFIDQFQIAKRSREWGCWWKAEETK